MGTVSNQIKLLFFHRPNILGRALLFISLASLTSACIPQEQALPTSLSSTTSSAPSYNGFDGATAAQTLGPTKVEVFWNPSSDPNVVAYNIYDTTLIFNPRLIKTVRAPATSATLTSLNPESYYTFRVRAADAQNNEDGNTQDISAIPYGGITGTQVLSSTSATVLFNDGSNADQVNIYCKSNLNPTYQLLKSLINTTATQTTLSGLSPGAHYTCRAALESQGFEDNNTQTVSFTPIGTATQLTFDTQPGSAPAGSPLGTQPVVKILDSFGNVVSAGPDSSALITLSVSSSSPTAGTVHGTFSLTAVNGVATFTDINLQESGDKILTATKADTSAMTSGSGPLSVDSNPFTITPGVASATKSTITLSPAGPITADGVTAYTVSITLKDQYGNPISGIKPRFASSISGDTLTQPTSVTDTTGVATGMITATQAGTRTLTISSPSGLSSATASADFIAGPAKKLGFYVPPATSPAGNAQMPDFKVAVEDAQGNVITSDNSTSISISISTNPSGGTLSGTTTATAVNGIATFSGIGIDKTGTGYKLVATSSPLTPAYSPGFNITAGSPQKIGIIGPASITSGLCSTSYTFQLQDMTGNPAKALVTTSIPLSGFGNAAFYTAGDCSGSPKPVNSDSTITLSFTAGTDHITLYMRDSKGEALSLLAHDPSSVMSDGTLSVAVGPSQVALSGPSSVPAGTCSAALNITTKDAAGNSANVLATTNLEMTGLTGTTAQLFSNSNCTTQISDTTQIPLTLNSSTTKIYLKDDKAESLSLNIVDPNSVIATTSPAVSLAVIPSNIKLTGQASLLSGVCGAYMLEFDDATGNAAALSSPFTLAIAGQGNGTFYNSASCSPGTELSSISVAAGTSSMPVYFADNTAETLSLVISDPSGQMADSPALAVQITPSNLVITSPASSVKTGYCTSAYTLQTQDKAGNVAAVQSALTVDLTGANTGGAFYDDAQCTNAITQLSFSAGDTSKTFYFMSVAPSAGLTLTATDSAASLTSGTASLIVQAAPGWIGTAASASNDLTPVIGKLPVAVENDGPSSADAIHFDATKQNLYVADWYSNNVLKYVYDSGSGTYKYFGWIGQVDTLHGIYPSGSNVSPSMAAACASVTNGATTPGWCIGGGIGGSANTGRGAFGSPISIADDGTSIFIANYTNGTVSRYNASTGTFMGWIGTIQATQDAGTPALSSGTDSNGNSLGNPCNSSYYGKTTPGWCYGGLAAWNSSTGIQVGLGDGTLSNPRSVVYANPYLYVADQGAILRYDSATGAFAGWIGMASSTTPALSAASGNTYGCATSGGSVNPGWCIGGTFANTHVSLTSNQGAVNDPTSLYADAANDLLYVVDFQPGPSVVEEFQLSTGHFLKFLNQSGLDNPQQMASDGTYLYIADYDRIIRMDPTNGAVAGWIGKVSTPPSGGTGCSGLQTNDDTPGWCLGGSAKFGLEEQAVAQATAVDVDINGNLFVGQGRTGGGEGQYPGIREWNAATGAYEGILSQVDTSPKQWSVDTSVAAGLGVGDQAFNIPEGAYSDGTHLFVVDMRNGRIKEIDPVTGEVVGWIGGITTKPTGPSTTCTGVASAIGISPSWCVGAMPYPSFFWYVWGSFISPETDGLMREPLGLTGDGTYLYVTDYYQHRIQKFRISDGAYMGWIGGISSTSAQPTLPAGGNCPGTPGQYTGAWCLGGDSTSGSGDGFLSNPTGITAMGGELYVVDSSNNRISRYNASTGIFDGWTGGISDNCTNSVVPVSNGSVYVTAGWCKGGTPIASGPTTGDNQGNIGNVPVDPGGAFNFTWPGWQRVGITNDGTYLYVSNTGNNRIDKFNVNGVYQASIHARWDVSDTWSNTPSGNDDGYLPIGLWTDGSSLYVAVQYGGWGNDPAIVKRDITPTGNGALVGWKGHIRDVPSGGDPGCAGASGVTPGWCTGGYPIWNPTLGGFVSPSFITGDANFIYVSDQNTDRVTRLPK